MRRPVRHAPCALGSALTLLVLLLGPPARAQLGGMGGQRPSSGPTQTGPTQTKQVGPRSTSDEDENTPQVIQRVEPQIAPPADPLAISPELRARMGTDYDSGPPQAEGSMQHPLHLLPPYYEERKGDYRLRMFPPFWIEHTRGLGEPGEVHYDRESLYGLFYYQRRSSDYDMDVLFPLAWRVRDKESKVLVLGPVAHREAPGEHDNWLAPLFFEGSRKDGGYFHSPLLLTTAHKNEKGYFQLTGPYFRDRTGTDVDWGVVPLLLHGDNGDVDGARRTYTLIPPLLYYHNEHEVDESQLTVVGPVISRSNPKRSIFDVAPLLFTITGRPETGGVRESHVTLFPLFHYGTSPDQNLFVVPGYFRRVTAKGADTMLTPLYSYATTRHGGTALTLLGPVLPFYYHYRDSDIGLTSFYVAPFYYHSSSPAGVDFLTPLVGRFESYGVSRSWWFFPNVTTSTDLHGWETDIHPLLYLGRGDQASHTVIAPVFWDFANPKTRATIAFPLYWRFADASDSSVTQIAGNTLYRQKRAVGGIDWQFHLLPLFSYGESPQGYWWNFLFGLAGFDKESWRTRIRAFWIPITVAGGDPPRAAALR